jgi:hypothetical protein
MIREKRILTLKTSTSKLLIQTLQNALKDVYKLERLYFESKQKTKAGSMQIEERHKQRLLQRDC